MFCKDTKNITNRTICKNFLLENTLITHFEFSPFSIITAGFYAFRAKTSGTETTQQQNKQTDYQQNETYRLFF